MQHVYGLSREAFLLQQEMLLDETLLASLVTRRLNHEPLAYLLGEQEFYGLNFKVSPATLIPRSDSETLIDRALKALVGVNHPRILDLGTGSGALLITILHLTHGFGVGVDISRDALTIARENAKMHKVDAVFLQSDFASSLKGEFDLILSNPPYIETKTIATLQQDVRDFEPHLALDGGEDGLNCYRVILAQAKDLLSPQGQLLFEIGQGQETALKTLAGPDYHWLGEEKDLNGIIRAIAFKRKSHAPHQPD